LRQKVSGDVFLFKPQRAWRYRWNKYTDTPLPPDEPAGQNPPDGAIIDYYLASNAKEVTLQILDSAGKLIRKYSSSDPVEEPKDTGQVPWYWIRPRRGLPATAGMHRVTWDLHYAPAPGTRVAYPIAATPFDTAPAYASPWVVPGTFSVKLTAN